MKKILLFCSQGNDDSIAFMYALLHPQLEVVGIVSSYGNVKQEQATGITQSSAGYSCSIERHSSSYHHP